MGKLDVLNLEGKTSQSIDLPDDIFGGRVNKELLNQAIVMYRASQRQGNASTKERADVKGGGAKPYRQKGTGRARVGSNRSPLWKGGGVVFGPHPRDFSYDVPKKIKKAALRESLNAKYQDKNLLCLEDLKTPLNKTKEFAKILSVFGLKGKTLAVLDGSDPSLEKVSRNIPYFKLVRSQDVNAYDVLKNKKLLVSQTALKQIIERIRK